MGIDIFEGGYGISTTTMIMTSKYGILTIYSGEYKNISLIKRGDIVLLHRQSLQDTCPREDNKYPGHCGIYLGDNRFIHCSGTKKKVLINTFYNNYWYKKLVGSKDFIS
jgi:cell wall-associated NlpC family hydrolase